MSASVACFVADLGEAYTLGLPGLARRFAYRLTPLLGEVEYVVVSQATFLGTLCETKVYPAKLEGRMLSASCAFGTHLVAAPGIVEPGAILQHLGYALSDAARVP